MYFRNTGNILCLEIPAYRCISSFLKSDYKRKYSILDTTNIMNPTINVNRCLINVGESFEF